MHPTTHITQTPTVGESSGYGVGQARGKVGDEGDQYVVEEGCQYPCPAGGLPGTPLWSQLLEGVWKDGCVTRGPGGQAEHNHQCSILCLETDVVFCVTHR